jgi:hypothetical protein
MKKLLLATALATGLTATAAHATFIKADVADTKIFFNSAKDTHAFTGNVDKNNTGPLVNFLAGVGTVDVGNGFANIKDAITSDNADFTRLVITPTEDTWSAFTFRAQLNPVGFTGEVDLAVVNQFGQIENFAFTGLAGANTDFADVGIKSIDNQRIASITLTTPGLESFKELKQFEVQRREITGCTGPDCPVINPTDGGNVPEPASIALLGAGMVGMVFLRRRKPLA